MIFERYLALGSFRKLVAELDATGAVTKQRLVSGKLIGGIRFANGPLAYLLKNRIYLGETNHNGSFFAGEHAAIIDRAMFDQVQELIKSHRVDRTKRRNDSGALLKGLPIAKPPRSRGWEF